MSLSQEEYDKAIGQFRLQLNGCFIPFASYGHDVFVSSTITTIIKLALKLHYRLNGYDVPITKED